MEKFFTKYLSLILLGVIVIITLTTLFRVPDNLEKAMDKISRAEGKIDTSIQILKGQTTFLDSLIRINEALISELDSLKKTNATISSSIDKKLNSAKWYLQKIKADIEKFPEKFDDIK
jgi:uncharacterized protein YoxC